MFRWSMAIVIAAALLSPATLMARQDAAVQEQAEAQRAAEEAHREAAAARREMEQQVREMADRARELAAIRAEVAVDGLPGGRLRVAGRARATEKGAWLGVSTSKVPAALRQHLQLQNKYIGLLVERVEPDSPAANAGLEQFDIIERLNDQWIVNTEQFSVVLRMQEPGQEVTLSIIRKGQPQKLTATPLEKDVPVLGVGEFEFFQGNAIAALGAGGDGAAWVNVAPQGQVIIRDPAGFEPLMQFRRLNEAANSQVVIKDQEHTLKMTTNKGQRNLVASDADGVVIFEGPINTEEEIAAVPDEIREKVQRMLETPAVAPAPPAPPVAAPAPRPDPGAED
jgi:serine protease Do